MTCIQHLPETTAQSFTKAKQNDPLAHHGGARRTMVEQGAARRCVSAPWWGQARHDAACCAQTGGGARPLPTHALSTSWTLGGSRTARLLPPLHPPPSSSICDGDAQSGQGIPARYNLVLFGPGSLDRACPGRDADHSGLQTGPPLVGDAQQLLFPCGHRKAQEGGPGWGPPGSGGLLNVGAKVSPC